MSTLAAPAPLTAFSLPPRLAASEPPEARGLRRDQVRMLVARLDGVEHARFYDLGHILQPGDLLVINISSTRPSAVDGVRTGGEPIVVHFSTPAKDGGWIVELRADNGAGPVENATAGESIELNAGCRLDLEAAHPDPANNPGSRLWQARVGVAGSVEAWLVKHGRPISYGYLHGRWPLTDYQTVFAREYASAEMPSAGRPFTHRLVTDLVAAGINLAPVVLHCGVSSLEAGEPPPAERFRVPESTAWLVNETRNAGGRVIAVGTSATRAIETVSGDDGSVSPGRGWTDLMLGPDHPARTVDALITGWHPPRASHLLLLEAVAGPEMVQNAYSSALSENYLWHEFGDSCLLLPPRGGRFPGTPAD